MAQNIGTLVGAAIRPGSTDDVFATAFANEIRGGHHQVADIAARDAIKEARLELGMLCTTQDTGIVYVLSQITPVVWDVFSATSADIISGVIPLSMMTNVYTISHSSVTGTSVPVASIVAPTSGDVIFGFNIVNVQNDQFTVILSDTPEVSGYYLNWINAAV